MGRMKELVMEMEERFWDHAIDLVYECEVVEDFLSEVGEHRHLLPMHSDSEFTEVVVDAWNEYWQSKGHA